MLNLRRTLSEVHMFRRLPSMSRTLLNTVYHDSFGRRWGTVHNIIVNNEYRSMDDDIFKEFYRWLIQNMTPTT